MNHFAPGPEIRIARRMGKRAAEAIKEFEAQRLEKHFDNDYIICLVDDGKEQSYHSLTMVKGKHDTK